jgi:hypothetical protein
MTYIIYVCIYAQHVTHTGTTCSPVSNVAAVGVLTHAATQSYAHMYDIYACIHAQHVTYTHTGTTCSPAFIVAAMGVLNSSSKLPPCTPAVRVWRRTVIDAMKST